MKLVVKSNYRINHSAWYLMPVYYKALRETAEQQAGNLPIVKSSDIDDWMALFINPRPPMSIDANGIATISIQGVLGRECAPIDKLWGMCGYEDIDDDIDEATDRGAKAVLFDIDSPGGEAAGAPETAAKIAGIDVPKASFCSGMDCSAAYFLSSSMDRKFASPSAVIGSIGTIFPWVDSSKMWDMMGLSWDPITGDDEDLKGAGMGPSITDAQKAHFQDQINQMSAAFRDHVSEYRDLDYSKLQAGAYSGKQALDLGLIDKIGTFDDCYSWLLARES